MSKIWEAQSMLVYETWIDAIISEVSDKLSSWEISFIESLRNRLSMKQQLTQLQAEKLEQIYVKYTH